MLLAVFLNNKLITCDTAVPFVMDVVRAKPDMKVEFYVTDVPTFDAIQDNVVLWDAVHEVGTLVQLGRTTAQRKQGLRGLLSHRMGFLARFLRLLILGLLGQATFIHFRALNHWPLRLLYVVNPMKTYVSEGMVSGYSEAERRVDNSDRQRVDYMENSAAKGGVIAYSDDWDALSYDSLQGVPPYVMGKFWYGRAWPDYIATNADRYISNELLEAGYAKDSKIIVYILGFLGAVESVPDGNTFKSLLLKSLKILHEENHDVPVFLKPHFNTNVKELQEILDEFPNNNFVISYLHPAVLSKRARFFMANYYSTTMSVARAHGVPNVEFSSYSKIALEVAAGQSMRPDLVDFYINNDSEEFRKTVRTILEGPVVEPRNIGSDDPSGVISKIAGKTA